MKLESVGEVIATREYRLLQDGAKAEKYQILLGKPQQTPNQSDFYCPYQIKGHNRDKIMAIYGLDAFQAIQLALRTIGVELEVIQRDSNGSLDWDGAGDGDLGFPQPD